MKRRTILAGLSLVIAVPALAQASGQVVRVPGPGGAMLATTVLRPPVDGRMPLVVINHGSPPSSAQRPRMALPRFTSLSQWFLARGYVVALPLRRGYGENGGDWAEDYGPCEAPAYFNAGLQGAADIRATIDYMRAQPYVAPDRTLVVGHSAGGWATLALSSQNPPGVAGMINFAGGRGGHQKQPVGGLGNCTPSELVSAAGRYGAAARVPTLWIYAANDSFFEPVLAKRMFDAFTGAGGRGTWRPVPAFGSDGHSLASSESGAAVWQGPVTEFLAGLR